jgi:hypothetical protein
MKVRPLSEASTFHYSKNNSLYEYQLEEGNKERLLPIKVMKRSIFNTFNYILTKLGPPKWNMEDRYECNK